MPSKGLPATFSKNSSGVAVPSTFCSRALTCASDSPAMITGLEHSLQPVDSSSSAKTRRPENKTAATGSKMRLFMRESLVCWRFVRPVAILAMNMLVGKYLKMQSTDFYQQTLGIPLHGRNTPPWKIVSVDLDIEAKRLVVRAEVDRKTRWYHPDTQLPTSWLMLTKAPFFNSQSPTAPWTNSSPWVHPNRPPLACDPPCRLRGQVRAGIWRPVPRPCRLGRRDWR